MGVSLSSNIEALFEKMESFITTKAVVGEPINYGDVVIIPLIEIGFGVGAAGGDAGGGESAKAGMSGGGLGAKITPFAVIVITNGTVQLVNVKSQDSVNKLVDMIPGILSKFDFDFLKKKENKDTTEPGE